MLLTVGRKQKIEKLIDRNKNTMTRSGSSTERNEIQRTIDIVETFLNHAIVVEISECTCDPTGLRDFVACDFCRSKVDQEKELVY